MGFNPIEFLKLDEKEKERLIGREKELEEDMVKYVFERLVDELTDEAVDELYEDFSEKEIAVEAILNNIKVRWPDFSDKLKLYLVDYKQKFNLNFFLKYHGG